MLILKSQKGFTLIELLVVIAIISILTSIIMANLTQSKAKARDTKRVSDMAQIQLTLELFFDRCNQYPAVSSNMPNITSFTGCPSGITLGTFISQIPNPPTAGDYTYVVNAIPPTDYVLRAKLETLNVALNDDIDGTVYSTDCSDSPTYYYCVQPR